MKQFLETKNAHTKYKGFRKSFARLKVIAYDLDEIWSLDLAHVDKLLKQNAGIKYLLIAVDCLSRYLRVEPLKSKYATTTAEAFKRMSKHKQPIKVWVDAGTEFKGNFKTPCQRRNIKIYQTFSEKKSAFAERNIRSLKNFIYKYLEEKWTFIHLSVEKFCANNKLTHQPCNKNSSEQSNQKRRSLSVIIKCNCIREIS